MQSNEAGTAVAQVPPFCLTRQAAITYIGVKPSFFDERIRPLLSSMRAGTSILYQRLELEQVVIGLFQAPIPATKSKERSQEDTSTPDESKTKWEKKQPVSFKAAMGVGKSINTSTENDFASAFTVLKMRKHG